jgi:phenylacetate-coenzyme A ligase PaaK-like adenylate-forming protein
MNNFEKKIFEISNENDFSCLTLEIFRFQAEYSPVYKKYLSLIGCNPVEITSIDDIPYLPVTLFKTNRIITDGKEPEAVFSSSSTTGMTPSRHYIASVGLYEKSFTEAFRIFYGEPSGYTFLCLLPSYLEREGSSLVYMADRLSALSANPDNGFYLYNHAELYEKLLKLRNEGIKTILLGVSFALIDFATSYKIDFPELIVMETGGMKGRGQEMSREAIHTTIKNSFGVKTVHSEYGMAELLSQSYSKGDGLYFSAPWKRVMIRDLSDPFSLVADGKRGGVNIIDLANLYSCSFIETEDLGMKEAGNSFRILGRISDSELRGCNLLL